VPARNRWQVISVLRRLLLSANADCGMIGEEKAKVKAGQKERKCPVDAAFSILEEANGSEVVHVQEKPLRNLLQARIVESSKDG
jgi:hypothetical protein